MNVQPFRIQVSQAVLDDLHERLAQTRWFASAEKSWKYGVSLPYLKELANYWQHHYDWRAQEAALNDLPQYRTEIDGIGVHFVHVRGRGEKRMPLLLTHGWPDSFMRFQRLIPLLAEAADFTFDLVIPSIPGFGFSDPVVLAEDEIADLWAKLMTEVLGYERFAAAGGDVGSIVTMSLAKHHPDRVIGIHVTDAGYPAGQEVNLTAAEQEFAAFVGQWMFSQGAYAMLQMSKPWSHAFALNDSPVGLAAWILSFINTGAEDHDVERAFGDRDSLLTNIMIYWVTQTIHTAAQQYFVAANPDNASNAAGSYTAATSEVPGAVAVFPREAPIPREWAERTLNVKRFTTMPHGGHFAALEVPQLLADDIREFFTSLT